jgi:tetratricopeptide (TPR) repeat protein
MDWNRYKELNMLEHFGRFEEALRGLDELESECSDPEDKVLLLLSISNCLGRLKRYPEARQPLEKAFGLVGEHSHLHPRIAFKYAYIDIYLRNWKGALIKLDAILKESGDTLRLPENDDLLGLIRSGRGVVLAEMRRYREALPLLEQAVVANPEDPVILTYLGACYFDVKELGRSKECFVKALKLELDSSYRHKAHYFLGSIYYAQGNFAWAKQEFEESLKQGEDGEFADANVYEYLRRASQSLGLESEVDRYSELLQQVARSPKTSK